MNLNEVVKQFQIKGTIQEIVPYGNGHINDTYLVTMAGGQRPVRYILQRMNTNVFKNPVQLMENIRGVTGHLKKKIEAQGGDADREALQVIPTLLEESFYQDGDSQFFRLFLFIEDALSLDAVRRPADFYESAVAFGNFQSLLADYPAKRLHETIPHFHDTDVRFQTFLEVLERDIKNRAKGVAREVEFVLSRKAETGILTTMKKRGELPLRVTHNDTKLNNVMLDKQTGRGICVIDLDTVMPGLTANDFGDAIRFGANTAAEDEQDLTKVSLDLDLYQLYLDGFLMGCRGSLTGKEIEVLPLGAKLMTFECGIRFLTDYLDGDNYFKIHREGHNLDRARTQFALVADMEKKWPRMQEMAKTAGKKNH